VRRRHDPFHKLLYRAGARDAITLFFPDIAACIDWSAFQWIDKEVAIPGARPRAVIADLVGLTRDIEGRHLEILIHPEIQMEAAGEIGGRALQHNAALWLQQANLDARVLTFVFYHCRGAGGIGKRRYALEFYGHEPLAVEYWSVGLGELDAESFTSFDNPMAGALAAWMRQKPARRVEQRLRLQARILGRVADRGYRRLLLDTVRSYYRLSRSEQVEEERLLQSPEFREGGETMLTELGRLERAAERRGRQVGLQAGRQEGLQQGRVEALQDAVLRILRRRFPPLAEAVEARVRRIADFAQLEQLIEDAATMSRLADEWPAPGGPMPQ
jgi:hypothetical protein